MMVVLNMMIMYRIGAGREEEKGVINRVATESKKTLLLTLRPISRLRRMVRMGREKNPCYKVQILSIARDFIR